MSDPTSPNSTEPSENRALLTAIGWIGVILIFVLILWLAYLPTRPNSVDQALIDQRIKTLADVQAKQTKLVNSYEVIDAENNVVRIPIERAMELTVQRLNSKPSSGQSATAPAGDVASTSSRGE